jgi:hypothetical protein
MKLPEQLRQDADGATARVYSWNPRNLQLSVELAAGNGGHRGVVTFDDVHHFCLPTAVHLRGVEATRCANLPERFWGHGGLARRDFDDEEVFFLLDSPAGGRYFVVARSMDYERS